MFVSDLSKYISIYILHIKRQFSYRFEFALWGILHPLRLVIMYYLWTSIFSYSGAVALGGLTVSEMIMYFVTSTVLDTYVNVDSRMGESINRGDIVIGFIRPITIFFEQLLM